MEEPILRKKFELYSVSSSPDVSTQTQLVSTCTHCSCAREPMCAISLVGNNLELHVANKRATSLLGNDEYRRILIL